MIRWGGQAWQGGVIANGRVILGKCYFNVNRFHWRTYLAWVMLVSQHPLDLESPYLQMDWHSGLDGMDHQMDVEILAFEANCCPSHGSQHQKAPSDSTIQFRAWHECAEDHQPLTCTVLSRWDKSTR